MSFNTPRRRRIAEMMEVYHSLNNKNVSHLDSWVCDELMPFYYSNGTAIIDEQRLNDLQQKSLVFQQMATVDRQVQALRYMIRQPNTGSRTLAKFFIENYDNVANTVMQINTNVCVAFSTEANDRHWHERLREMSNVTNRVLMCCMKLCVFVTQWAMIAYSYQMKLNSGRV